LLKIRKEEVGYKIEAKSEEAWKIAEVRLEAIL